jgi:hypothetical protein
MMDNIDHCDLTIMEWGTAFELIGDWYKQAESSWPTVFL